MISGQMPSRRQVAVGAAWTAPAVVAGAMAPMAAASCGDGPVVTMTGPAELRPCLTSATPFEYTVTNTSTTETATGGISVAIRNDMDILGETMNGSVDVASLPPGWTKTYLARYGFILSTSQPLGPGESVVLKLTYYPQNLDRISKGYAIAQARLSTGCGASVAPEAVQVTTPIKQSWLVTSVSNPEMPGPMLIGNSLWKVLYSGKSAKVSYTVTNVGNTATIGPVDILIRTARMYGALKTQPIAPPGWVAGGEVPQDAFTYWLYTFAGEPGSTASLQPGQSVTFEHTVTSAHTIPGTGTTDDLRVTYRFPNRGCGEIVASAEDFYVSGDTQPA